MAITEGSVVKCIDASVKPEQVAFVLKHMPSWVKKGQKYTIRAICQNGGIVDGYLLEEIVNPPCQLSEDLGGDIIEPRFATWRFAEEQEQTRQVEIEQEQEETIHA